MVDNDEIVLIDIKKCKMSVQEFLARMDQYRQEPRWMDYEFYLDWADYKIKAKLRKKN